MRVTNPARRPVQKKCEVERIRQFARYNVVQIHIPGTNRKGSRFLQRIDTAAIAPGICRGVSSVLLVVCLHLICTGGTLHLSGQDLPTDSADVAASGDSLVIRYDSSSPAIRSVNEQAIAAYRDDSDFDYARKEPPATSFFERFGRWISRLFESLFGNSTVFDLVQYLIAGAAIVLVIVLLARSEFAGFFRRKGAEQSAEIDFEEIEENIDLMNFDALISAALASDNLRRAVRLRYLQLLRVMSERGVIEWRIEKTNRDYLYELQRVELRSGFSELTRVFDYVWYGDFPIQRKEYDRISRDFDAFTSSVEAAR